MPAIEQIRIQPTWATDDLWNEVARHTLAWLARSGVAARDAVLLVPFADLADPARSAFGRAGGWQPRIETVLTLSAAWAPPSSPAFGACTGDAVLDHLSADALLRQQPWGRAWAGRDAAGFDLVVGAVVQAAQVLRAAAGERAPEAACAFWDQARALLRAPQGPAATEALLLQLALEWAAASAGPDTTTLHDARPAAWVVLRLGGADAAAEALLDRHGLPSLLLDLDPVTWQRLTSDLRLPANTDFLLINLMIPTQKGTSLEKGFAGHYIDDVRLTLSHSPLPSK